VIYREMTRYPCLIYWFAYLFEILSLSVCKVKLDTVFDKSLNSLKADIETDS